MQKTTVSVRREATCSTAATWRISEGKDSALLSVYRDSEGALVLSVWNADPDVLVRTPFANLDADRAGVVRA